MMLWQWDSIKTGIDIIGHVMISRFKILYYKQQMSVAMKQNH